MRAKKTSSNCTERKREVERFILGFAHGNLIPRPSVTAVDPEETHLAHY
jgi:hypothetical protein